MESVVLLILAVVVTVVAIDAIARLDERDRRKLGEPRKRRGAGDDTDPTITTTQKIIVDLTRRH